MTTNYSALMMLANDNIRAIRCVYEPTQENSREEPKQYVFKSLDPSIKIGDLVVVPSTTRHKRTIVKVTEVGCEIMDLIESTIQVEWIVGKVDNADYAYIKRVEDEAINKIKANEKARKKKELQAKFLADDEEFIKSLPIVSMKSLPGATPEDTSAASVEQNPPFTYKNEPASPISDVEF